MGASRGQVAFLTAIGVALTIAAAPNLPTPPLIPHAEFMQCDNGRYTGNDYCQSAAVVAGTLAALVDAINQYRDVIIALGTVALAWFTFTLWRSTHDLVEAGKTQSKDMNASIREAARAATAMETMAANILRASRPKCSVARPALSTFRGAVPAVDPTKGPLWSLHAEISNRGVATGFPREVRAIYLVGKAIGPPLTQEGTPDRVTFDLLAVKADKQTSIYPPILSVQIPSNPPEGHSLYIWGWLRYADLHGTIRRAGFAYERPLNIQLSDEDFFACGSDAYWYDIEEKA